METKTARLTLLIDPQKKAAFERLCAQQDRTASQVVRQLIRDYLTLHGVALVPASQPRPVAARKATSSKPRTTTPTKPADLPASRRRG